MGSLTAYLQREFELRRPPGWSCRREVRVVSPEIESLLGYAPRADVLLERDDGSRRLWIEFEVSRADPVANHAKFATAHLFQPQPHSDAFVAMVSSHVDRGRRNLALNAIFLMRHIGLNAFQTVLFPHLAPSAIKRLNHLDASILPDERLHTEPEIQRAITVSEALAMTHEHRIHFVGDLFEVLLNVRRWNTEIVTPEGADLWGKRTIQYFVFDPQSRHFAPSKFCAYSAVGPPAPAGRTEAGRSIFGMTIAFYSILDESDPRFDGGRARQHLMDNLGMKVPDPESLPRVRDLFHRWLACHTDQMRVHRAGPVLLAPHAWFKSSKS